MPHVRPSFFLIRFTRLSLLCVLLSGALGCSTQKYSYRAVAAAQEQFPGAFHVVSENGKDSSIQIRFRDFVQRKGRKQFALILRLFFDNKDKEDWYFEPKKQQIQIYANHHEVIQPLFELAGSTKTISSGPTQFLDLAYPLPESIQRADDLKDFEFLGQIGLPTGSKSLYTSFSRVLSTSDSDQNTWTWQDRETQ